MHQLLQCIDRNRLLQVHCKALLSAQEVSEQCITPSVVENQAMGVLTPSSVARKQPACKGLAP